MKDILLIAGVVGLLIYAVVSVIFLVVCADSRCPLSRRLMVSSIGYLLFIMLFMLM